MFLVSRNIKWIIFLIIPPAESFERRWFWHNILDLHNPICTCCSDIEKIISVYFLFIKDRFSCKKVSVDKTVLNKTNDYITHIISYGEITFLFRINISILNTCVELIYWNLSWYFSYDSVFRIVVAIFCWSLLLPNFEASFILVNGGGRSSSFQVFIRISLLILNHLNH